MTIKSILLAVVLVAFLGLNFAAAMVGLPVLAEMIGVELPYAVTAGGAILLSIGSFCLAGLAMRVNRK